MPQRFQLNAVGMTRVRVGPTLGPLAESLLALGTLRVGSATARRPVVGELRQRASDGDRALASFLWVTPAIGLDLFTLAAPTATIGDGRDAVLGAAPEHVSAEMAFWFSVRARASRLRVLPTSDPRLLPDLTGLRDGATDSVRALLVAVEEFHRRHVAPVWPVIRDQLLAEQVRLGQRLAGGGVEALMTGLGPKVGWTGTAVEVPSAGISGAHAARTTPLGGRGLIVSPSFFATEPAVYVPADGHVPALLLVPVRSADLGRQVPSDRTARPGADLLGPTRSAVLAAVAGRPRTTSELSAELGIALSGASQHAAVLRRAGLISSTRDGGRVLHAVTELGAALLSQVTA